MAFFRPHVHRCLLEGPPLALRRDRFSTLSITFADYAAFLEQSTLGNAISGGFFVEVLKYGHVVRGGKIANLSG